MISVRIMIILIHFTLTRGEQQSWITAGTLKIATFSIPGASLVGFASVSFFRRSDNVPPPPAPSRCRLSQIVNPPKGRAAPRGSG